MRELQLADLAGYRARLEADAAEWHVFDACCHITISRFFRDKGVFGDLGRQVLPDIAARAEREQRDARVWSAGCASGEEPYTLKILWDLEVAPSRPSVGLSIVATDVDAGMLARARRGCFAPTSLRELPPHLVGRAFDRVGRLLCIQPRYRQGIDFVPQDMRSEAPGWRFDLVLCRYVAFTYFTLALQDEVLQRILERLRAEGYLVIGTHERLPADGLPSLAGGPHIFRKTGVKRRAAAFRIATSWNSKRA
jgi:chemotaxis protein methyltransferase CheR